MCRAAILPLQRLWRMRHVELAAGWQEGLHRWERWRQVDFHHTYSLRGFYTSFLARNKTWDLAIFLISDRQFLIYVLIAFVFRYFLCERSGSLVSLLLQFYGSIVWWIAASTQLSFISFHFYPTRTAPITTAPHFPISSCHSLYILSSSSSLHSQFVPFQSSSIPHSPSTICLSCSSAHFPYANSIFFNFFPQPLSLRHQSASAETDDPEESLRHSTSLWHWINDRIWIWVELCNSHNSNGFYPKSSFQTRPSSYWQSLTFYNWQ